MPLKNAKACKGCQALGWDDRDHKWRCEISYPQGLEPAWWPTPLEPCPKPVTVAEFEAAKKEKEGKQDAR